MKVTNIFPLLIIFLTGCTYVSPLVNTADLSDASKLITKTKCFGMGWCWQSSITKVFDKKGNTVVEEGGFWSDVILPSGEFEVIVRCSKNNMFGFRSIFLNTRPGIQYELECVKDRVNTNPKVIIANESSINNKT